MASVALNIRHKYGIKNRQMVQKKKSFRQLINTIQHCKPTIYDIYVFIHPIVHSKTCPANVFIRVEEIITKPQMLKSMNQITKTNYCVADHNDFDLIGYMSHLLPLEAMRIIEVIKVKPNVLMPSKSKRKNKYGVSTSSKFKIKQVYGTFSSGLLPPQVQPETNNY